MATRSSVTNMNDYKYTTTNKSTMDKKMDGFWNILIDYVPTWLHPNAITLIGFIIFMTHFLLFLSYGLDFNAPRPKWTFFYAIFTHFVYQTTDAIDGKQARKLKLSSPLGQLFDHGSDTFYLVILIYDFFVILGVGNDQFIVILGLLTIISNEIVGEIAEYHTSVFFYSNGSLGITECQFIFMLLFLILGIFGYDVLMFKNIYYTYCLSILMFVSNLDFPYVNIKRSIETVPLKTFLKSIVSSICFIISLVLIITKENIFLTFLITGSSFSVVNIKLIICIICKEKIQTLDYRVLPIILLGILTLMSPGLKYLNLAQYLVLGVNCLILFFDIKKAIDKICKKLKIGLFRLK